jgi:hypothetical protein
MTAVELLQHYAECADKDEWPVADWRRNEGRRIENVLNDVVDLTLEELPLPFIVDNAVNAELDGEDLVFDEPIDNSVTGLLPEQIEDLDERIIRLMDICRYGNDPIFDSDNDEDEDSLRLAWQLQQEQFDGLS